MTGWRWTHQTEGEGGRPRCRACLAKGRDCGYFGDLGQSRAEAMKARLASLEGLVGSRQKKDAIGGSSDLKRSGHSSKSKASSSNTSEMSASETTQGTTPVLFVKPTV